MKIMHVTSSLDTGGIENFLVNLTENMPSNEYEIIFLTIKNKKFDYEARLKRRGCKIIKLRKQGALNKFGLFFKARRVFKRTSPDIVHVHMGFNAAFVLAAAKSAGVKVRIAHSHSAGAKDVNVLWRIYNSVRRRIILHSTTIFLACSQKAGKVLFGSGIKFEVIPNGVELKKYAFDSAERKKLRASIGIGDGAIVVGHVGRLEASKNHRLLLKIFKELSADGRYELALVGDGALRYELEDLAKSLKISKSVHFLGNRADVAKLYSIFDLIIFPSLFEGLPISLVEAQANGLPILASDAISQEITLSSNIEFMSLNEDVKKWAKKAKDLSRAEPDYTRLRNFSIETTVKKLQSIYRESEK